ncbi:MAG: tetratricopeptide repeat protein, partial [Spirochaetaceae bacterium]|nr:tetratricopeptide repeat protein [Spirochaetaceae bacterium]
MISEKVQELLIRARNAFRLQDYETARKLVRQMLEEHPDSVTATILMGIIAGRTDKPGEAIKLFKRALELDPKSAEAYNNLA